LREHLIKQFREVYDSFARDIREVEGSDTVRPSVISHSYGSYIVGAAMQRFSELRFDKVLVCGSILPPDFDWAILIGRNQVWRVRNEYGSKDHWPRYAHWFVPTAGDSGSRGFEFNSPLVSENRLLGGLHSDFFHSSHYRNHWVPFVESAAAPVYVETGSQVSADDIFDDRLKQCREIDRMCYEGLPGYDEAKIPEGLSKEWVGINPDIYTFLLDARRVGRVMGYVNAMPLEDEAFEAVLRGELLDNDISANHVLAYTPGAKVKLYLMSVAVLPKDRRIGDGVRQSALDYMLFGLFARLAELARQNVCVTEIGAVAWTPAGRMLCRSLNMDEVRKDLNDHVSYRLRLDPELHAKYSHPALRVLARRYAEGDSSY
jgi:hypothetical protein